MAAARIAGIMAAKKTSELIPLCHGVAVTHVGVVRDLARSSPHPRHRRSVKVRAQTGVEMEALAAGKIACLTIYDMLKAADKAMTLDGIRLVEKTGGRSGAYRASDQGKR